jgi:Domain of unknown function (DUF1996)
MSFYKRLATLALAIVWLPLILTAKVPGPQVPAPAENPQQSVGTFFQIACAPSHKSNDDPIVFPGISAATHEHQFFANTGTDFAATYQSQLHDGTTCSREPEDTAAYWVPVLYDAAGVAHSPPRIRAYYVVHGKAYREQMLAPPPDLRMIAGDAAATGPQPDGIIEWLCRNKISQSEQLPLQRASPPTCRDTEYLAVVIHFPNCLARASHSAPALDSSDHRLHTAYANADRPCPSTHPLRIAKLRLSITYTKPAFSGGEFTLGAPVGQGRALPWYAMHADFWNTWKQKALQGYVDDCLRRYPAYTERPAGCNVVHD